MTKGKFALGALIGAIAGAIAGVLTAPKSGKETRQDLKTKAEDLKAQANAKKGEAVEKAEGLKDEAATRANDLRIRTEKAARSVKEAYTEKR